MRKQGQRERATINRRRMLSLRHEEGQRKIRRFRTAPNGPGDVPQREVKPAAWLENSHTSPIFTDSGVPSQRLTEKNRTLKSRKIRKNCTLRSTRSYCTARTVQSQYTVAPRSTSTDRMAFRIQRWFSVNQRWIFKNQWWIFKNQCWMYAEP